LNLAGDLRSASRTWDGPAPDGRLFSPTITSITFCTSAHSHVESRKCAGYRADEVVLSPRTDMPKPWPRRSTTSTDRGHSCARDGFAFVMRFDTGACRSVSGVVERYAIDRRDSGFGAVSRTSHVLQPAGRCQLRRRSGQCEKRGGDAKSAAIAVAGDVPDEVVTALVAETAISPSGNVPIATKYPIVPSTRWSVRRSSWRRFRSAPETMRFFCGISVTCRTRPCPGGVRLGDGRRAVYILATKRADASTLSVINNIKNALPRMKAAWERKGGNRRSLRIRPVP